MNNCNKCDKWSALKNYLIGRIGERAAEEFIASLKELYSLYEPQMIDWLAGLYDPGVGGFYYSNSARDNDSIEFKGGNYRLLPDAESTYQALNMLDSSGVTEDYGRDLPEFMRQQIVSFIISLQNENGYFYHAQWGREMTDSRISRRSRDLRWSESILSSFGARPLYTTPSGIVGSSDMGAISAVKVRSSADGGTRRVTNENLQDKESFVKYLSGLDIANRSYGVGSELTTQSAEILERDRQLALIGADYSLMNILIQWLNEHQHSDTGHWHTASDYYAVNGILKITGIYNAAEMPIPNAAATARSAIDAIISAEQMSAVVDLYNTWSGVNNVVKNLRKFGGEAGCETADNIVRELLLLAPKAIRCSGSKIAEFKKPDGSFSYGREYSSKTSMGMPVALPESYEGDVNATSLSVTGLVGNILGALELRDYRPPIFGIDEFKRFVNAVEEKNALLKNN